LRIAVHVAKSVCKLLLQNISLNMFYLLTASYGDKKRDNWFGLRKLYHNFLPLTRSLDSSLDTVMGCRLDSRSLIPGRAKRFFYTPQHPDWLWGPCRLLSTW
jgi:hypothetical protein